MAATAATAVAATAAAARQAVLPVSVFGSAVSDSNVDNDSNGGIDSGNGSVVHVVNVDNDSNGDSDNNGGSVDGSGGSGSDGCGSDASCSPSVFGSAVRSLWKLQSSNEGSLEALTLPIHDTVAARYGGSTEGCEYNTKS